MQINLDRSKEPFECRIDGSCRIIALLIGNGLVKDIGTRIVMEEMEEIEMNGFVEGG